MERLEDEPQLQLKPLSLADAESYFRLLDENRSFFANFDNTPADKYPDVEVVRASLADPVKLRWGIYRGGELIGTVNLKPWMSDEHVGEVGYLVAEKANGQGVATKAVKEMLMFNKRRYDSFIATVDPRNSASIRVLQKAGFTIDTETLSDKGEPTYRLRSDALIQ